MALKYEFYEDEDTTSNSEFSFDPEVFSNASEVTPMLCSQPLNLTSLLVLTFMACIMLHELHDV